MGYIMSDQDRDFIHKIGYEGGVFAACEYGLKAKGLDSCGLQDAWMRIQNAYAAFEHAELLWNQELKGYDP